MDSLTDSKKGNTVEEVFAFDSEMGALMRSYDWSQTSLGLIKNWSQSLKISIRIILGSRYPMFIWWGEEFMNFYNDAYIPILGQRHPDALGKSASDIWADTWHSVGSQALDVLNFGKPSWNEESLEILERNGYPEETYFTFSYSPIGNDDGGVGGIFCACIEDTKRVLDNRRLRTLRELGAETAKALTVNDACSFSTSVLQKNPHDIPFALIYLLRTSQKVELVSATLKMDETLLNKSVIDLMVEEELDCWSLQEVLTTGESRVIEDLINRFGAIECGAWNLAPNSARILPLKRPGQDMLGFLILGISPLRPFDDDYQGFFDLVAGQITMAISSARVYEEEHRRAGALAELDRAKTAFFNNVSHEFRTPLTLILNPLEQVISETLSVLNSDMRDYLKRLLSTQYQVILVANGTEALAAVEKQAPDLVLTDVMMPCSDGFELLSALRANPDTKDIPIILLSACAGEEAAIGGFFAGANDYLIKPFSAQELIACVDSHLEMARLRSELSSNRMKDEFLATVTHELHAPLTAILGWTRLLRLNQLDSATALRALDIIERNAKNQAKLISELLDISSILSGKVCLDNHPVNLTNIIKEEINNISSDAKAKGIEIIQTLHNLETHSRSRSVAKQSVPKVNLPAVYSVNASLQQQKQQDIYVSGDCYRLQQSFSKLLNNAIKFTPLGGSIKVWLSTVGSWATIEISDTGIGIGTDFLPHVFKRFTQAEVPSRHSPGGLGLGLFIAHQLIELHRGTIEAASDGFGLGATFTVKLPLDKLK